MESSMRKALLIKTAARCRHLDGMIRLRCEAREARKVHIVQTKGNGVSALLSPKVPHSQ
jgi:hypothetical protein